MKDNKIFTCDNRGTDDLDPSDPGAFIPVLVGALNNKVSSVTYNDAMCFKSVTFTYEQTGDDDDIGDILITVDT